MYKWIFAAVLSLFAVSASAAQGLYAGINFVKVDYKEDGFETLSPTALSFKLGKELTPNFAVEGRFGTGLSEDSITISGVTVDVEVDSFIGVYLKGMLPTGSVTPYAMIGYTDGEITASAGGFAVSADDSDFSYGIGVDIALSKTTALNFEFGQLFKGDGFKVEALSAGIAFKF